MRKFKTSGAQYICASANTPEPKTWSKCLCVNTTWVTRCPAICCTSASIACASVSVVPVSMSSVPVRPCTKPTVTSRNGSRQRCTLAVSCSQSKRTPGPGGRWLGAVDRHRRPGLGEQVAHDRTQLRRIPLGALVDLRAVCPAFSDADLAAFDLEHLPGDIAGFGATQPDDQR